MFFDASLLGCAFARHVVFLLSTVLQIITRLLRFTRYGITVLSEADEAEARRRAF